MTDSIFLAALKCCEEMAEIVGDEKHHQLYDMLTRKGAARADELMFDGEYYIQVQKEIDKININSEKAACQISFSDSSWHIWLESGKFYRKSM